MSPLFMGATAGSDAYAAIAIFTAATALLVETRNISFGCLDAESRE